MYAPKFTYTDRLVQNLIKLESHKNNLELVDLNYEVKYKLAINAKSLDVFYLSQSLGIKLQIKDAIKIIEGTKKLDEFDNEIHSIAMNLKRVGEFIRSSSGDNYPEFEKSTILSISQHILNQWRETWEAEYRNFNDKIDERWDNLVSNRDSSIIGQEVEQYMNELIEWYKYSIPTMAPLVRIAIVFYRLLEIAPFIAGNKFIIFVIIDNLLLKNGLSTKVYMSTFRALNFDTDKLSKMMMVVKQTNDMSLWIDTFVNMITTELVNVREELSKFIIAEEKSKAQPFLDLNKRQLKVLKYLQTIQFIKRDEYCHMMDVSTMTAFRDMDDLVRKKLLKVDGKGRGTKYKLAIN